MKKDVLYPTYVLIGLLLVVAVIVFFVYRYSDQNLPVQNEVSTPVVTNSNTYALTPEQVQLKQAQISSAQHVQKVTLTDSQVQAKLKLLKQLQAK